MSQLLAFYAQLLAGGAPPAALTPAPGWAYRSEADLLMPGDRQLVTVPGLATCSAVTVFLVFSKAPSAENLHMLCSFPTTDGAEVDMVYVGKTYAGGYFGFGYNAYADGFITTDPFSYLDNGVTRLVRASIQNNTVGGYISWYNGVYQPGYGRAGGQYPARAFTGQMMLGGDALPSGLHWPGRVLACYVYPTALSDAEAEQTEAYLRAKYPDITSGSSCYSNPNCKLSNWRWPTSNSTKRFSAKRRALAGLSLTSCPTAARNCYCSCRAGLMARRLMAASVTPCQLVTSICPTGACSATAMWR
jgi:hypothetical protein